MAGSKEALDVRALAFGAPAPCQSRSAMAYDHEDRCRILASCSEKTSAATCETTHVSTSRHAGSAPVRTGGRHEEALLLVGSTPAI